MKNLPIAPTVKMRDATRADLPQLFSMVEALAKHHEDVPTITIEALERDIFGDIPWVYVILSEVDGKVVGYATLCPLIQLQFGVRGIDLHHLFIEPGFRGVGIGRLLIEASMRKARQLFCSYMNVGTHPDNSAAQDVYTACGFDRCDGSHPRFRIALTL